MQVLALLDLRDFAQLEFLREHERDFRQFDGEGDRIEAEVFIALELRPEGGECGEALGQLLAGWSTHEKWRAAPRSGSRERASPQPLLLSTRLRGHFVEATTVCCARATVQA